MCFVDDSAAHAPNWDAPEALLLQSCDFDSVTLEDIMAAINTPSFLGAEAETKIEATAAGFAPAAPAPPAYAAAAPAPCAAPEAPAAGRRDSSSADDVSTQGGRSKRKSPESICAADPRAAKAAKGKADESEGECLEDIEEQRRQKRLIKNRLTALRSRERKKAEFCVLKQRVAELEAQAASLVAELDARDRTIAHLRAVMVPVGAYPHPHPAAYPRGALAAQAMPGQPRVSDEPAVSTWQDELLF